MQEIADILIHREWLEDARKTFEELLPEYQHVSGAVDAYPAGPHLSSAIDRLFFIEPDITDAEEFIMEFDVSNWLEECYERHS